MARDTLTREQIVRTTVAMLDSDGLDAFSMRALGARLGSAATAVYWHIESKDRLVRLAADDVWSEIQLPDLAVEWRTAATAMATALYQVFVRHPWLVQAFSAGSHFMYGPGKARYDDHSLAVYERAGFLGPEADRATATVFMFVLGSALAEAAVVGLRRRLSHDGADADELIRDAIGRASEIGMGFPRLRARLEAGVTVGYAAAPEKSFEFGLRVILDGLESALRSGS
ncbi:MAG: TetR/AcrR family transcriptional regulator [Gemmatimonadales bacterium]